MKDDPVARPIAEELQRQPRRRMPRAPERDKLADYRDQRINRKDEDIVPEIPTY